MPTHSVQFDAVRVLGPEPGVVLGRAVVAVVWFFRNAPVKLHPVALVRGVTFALEANAAWTIRVAVRHPAVVHVFEVETVAGPGTAPQGSGSRANDSGHAGGACD